MSKSSLSIISSIIMIVILMPMFIVFDAYWLILPAMAVIFIASFLLTNIGELSKKSPSGGSELSSTGLGVVIFVISIAVVLYIFSGFPGLPEFALPDTSFRWQVFPAMGILVFIALMLRGDHAKCLNKIIGK